MHELATFATLTVAAVYLLVHLVKISRPRTQASCARCEHNVQSSAVSDGASSKAIRSERLRVLGPGK